MNGLLPVKAAQVTGSYKKSVSRHDWEQVTFGSLQTSESLGR